MVPSTTIPQQHLAYRQQVAELDFCKAEIRIFEKQLAQIAANNPVLFASAQVEQFQNRFIRQKEVIDALKQALHRDEKWLACFVKEISGLGLESIKLKNITRLKEDLDCFRKIYQEMKASFRQFVATSL
jgi:peroxiredoxin